MVCVITWLRRVTAKSGASCRPMAVRLEVLLGVLHPLGGVQVTRAGLCYPVREGRGARGCVPR